MLHDTRDPDGWQAVAAATPADGGALVLDGGVLQVVGGAASLYLERPGRAGRRYLCGIAAGEVALAPVFGDEGWRMVAFLDGAGARAERHEAEAFLARLDAGDGGVIAATEAWIERIAARVGASPAGRPGPLGAGTQVLVPGVCARPAAGLLWVSLVQGATLTGHPEPVAPGAAPVPAFAAPGGGIAARDGEALIVCRDSGGLAAAGGLSRAVREHLRRVGRALEAREAAREAREAAFVAGKGAHDRALLATRVDPLVIPSARSDERDDGTRLAAAFRAVAEAGGTAWPDAEVGSAIRDPSVPVGRRVRALADEAGLGLREVRLDGRWWREGGHSLLAFRASDGAPLALIAGTGWRGGYRLQVGGRLRRVGPREAAGIAPDAYLPVRRLPDAPVDGRTLLRFASVLTAPVLMPLLLLAAAGSALGLVTPLASGILFDTIIPSAARTELVQLAAGIAGLGLGAVVFELVRGWLLLRLATLLDGDLEGALWDRLLHLPASFFRGFPAGDLALRATAINQMRDALGGTVVASLLAAVVSLSSLGLILTYDWRLAVLALGLVAVQVAVMVAVSLRMLAIARRILETEGRLQALALQLIQAIAKLKVAGAETRGYARWAPLFVARSTLARRQHTLSAGVSAFGAAFAIVSTATMIGVVGLGGPTIGVGPFVAFSAAYGQFIAATLSLGAVLPALLSLQPLYARAKPLLQAVPEARGRCGAAPELSGRLAVRDLVFRYRPDGPAILDGVSLRVEPGEFVAIVGASGSGKSTLLRLLLGFEAPTRGTIAYDERDLAALDVRAVRRQLGVVLQNGRIQNGTILDTIRNGLPLPEAQAWEAAHMAGLDDDVRAMPMGLHTFVGEDAGLLSGGQRQRLLIARALVHRPRLLLFDEATSALDNRTQQRVTERLAMLDATRLVIAHRLSTIRQADRIYVLDAGRVVEEGDYARLMQAGGRFRELVQRQLPL
ncbi:NHLP bacteriocin export ABC transporter permease/ATPase subunit [Methylobacterium oryzihabitans]|uniref:NHLP bacteriocin export ABC transporter permease/ATPase subunit n=1 Tax=Methylobacterium oryzihabitans TaxID=2499852 RepID=A0A3S2W6L6_9HYPH|nr:NHLP bacteriocin export ABC transporter permease/ATPase subunit [Methylobacterium oryzihabitans]RVU14977.1 NHLP bacteriocin export ABC transporter permease/ATPase subunit [Methylobacterium oryzihabitans]